MSHGDTKNVSKGIYKTKSGQIIEENKTIKDLGILTSKDFSFAEHLDELGAFQMMSHTSRRQI